MQKWQLLVLVMALATSQASFAGRMGDAWKGSQSRIHGRFTKGKGSNGGGGAFALLMTSSTTISSLSSTALTSGGSLLKEVALRDEFLDENLYAVKLDSAKGQGEYLRTLASLSGCKAPQAQTEFASKIRSNFKSVYGSSEQDPTVIADQIDEMIQGDSQLQKACVNIAAVDTVK
jgi:hypothetical protein